MADEHMERNRDPAFQPDEKSCLIKACLTRAIVDTAIPSRDCVPAPLGDYPLFYPSSLISLQNQQ